MESGKTDKILITSVGLHEPCSLLKLNLEYCFGFQEDHKETDQLYELLCS